MLFPGQVDGYVGVGEIPSLTLTTPSVELVERKFNGLKLGDSYKQNGGTEGWLKTRSQKPKIEEALDISFQNTILDSHKKATESILLGYERKLMSIVKLSEKIFQASTLPPSLNESPIPQNQLRGAIEECALLSKTEKVQMLLDFGHEPELSDLVTHLLSIVSPSIKPDIVCLSCFLWEQYLSARNKSLKFKPVIQQMRKSIHQQIDDLLESQTYRNITLKQRKLASIEEVKSAFTWFVLAMAETIGLVICGYFNNPYEDINEEEICCEARRLDWAEQSDEQHSEAILIEGEPGKRVKTYEESQSWFSP